ncbi:putative epidermal cell surface receptor isoform X2 [Cimex lectularius]|uniref:Epidermal cell surface receptor n=1 Tax=Cimex lectularius TaxID=79782 RepID=A0A8I6R9M4_CIMLE|nr:putative epidermal cell surface receptor isoform X2 [Cimex lectularius]
MALILWFLLLTASSSLAQSLPAADKGGGGKARALGESGNLTQVEKALDDVSMEEDGMPASCTEGQVVEHGCDEKCVCVEGKLNCTQRCAPPLVRSILGTTDPKCVLKPTSDKCCSSLVCSNSDNEATSTATAKVCTFKNETYKYGDVFHDGCSSTCNCMENGEVTCKPRCPSNNRTAISDRCLSVADTKDPCCKILYCDVNIDDMSVDEILEYFKLVSAVPSNATSVLLNLDKMTYVDNVEAEVSEDEKTWTPAKTIGHQVVDLTPGKTYYFRVIINGLVSNVVSTTTPSMNTDSSKCLYKGNTYKIGEEFHDGCTALCACFKTGIECATIECPTDFGLDVLDPQCLSWETKPHDFVPNPPHCCPETVICTNNGSCTYKDELFDNWADIPDKLTGCEEKCYCENGKVNCRPRCLPVPNSPPSDLPCSPNDAILTHTPGEDNCCLQWTCGAKQNGTGPNVTNNSVKETKMKQSLSHDGSSVPFLGPYSPDILGKAEKKHIHTSKEKHNFPGPYIFHDNTTFNHTVKSTVKPTPLTETQKTNVNEQRLNDSATDHELLKQKHKNISEKFETNVLINTASPGSEQINSQTEISLGVLNPNTTIEKVPTDNTSPAVHSNLDTQNGMSVSNNDFSSRPPIMINKGDNILPPVAVSLPNGPVNPDKQGTDKVKIDSQNILPYDKTQPGHELHAGSENQNENANKVPSHGNPEYSSSMPNSFDSALSGLWPSHEVPNKIPIGIINPDKLNNQNEKKPQNIPENVPNVNPNLLDHLLEYHHYQEKPVQNQGNYHNANHPQYEIPQDRPNPHDNSNQINPYLHQQIVTGKEVAKGVHQHVPYPHFPEHVNQVPLQRPPHLYHILPNGPQRFPQPPQFVSPEELYLVQNQQRLPQKQNVHPYFNSPTSHTRKEPVHYQNPNSPPLGLEDIIDQIRQHEGTDSHTKDTHVIVLASQPPNAGQAAPPRRPMPGFPIHPSQHDPNGIVVHTLEAVDENNVRLIFSVPLVLVGLHGRVELRYTSDKENSDPSTWEQKVFAPANDLIATSELQFELDDLQPDTEYKIKITVVMRDIENSPASKILVVKTPPAASAATVPPMIPVEPDLRVTKVNSSWAVLEWRKFTEDELHFIDGVQLRYKEINGKVYQATPLIHRAVTSYTLEGLKPDSQYEIGIFFIPFPGQTTELQAQKTVHVSTTIENDPYKFELMLDVHHIKSTTVEISWTGVPYPEDKYVNIFRAIYQYEGGREYMNTFKVAKRDSPASTLIQGLKPDTRYRLWLEAYLTNGRIKKSNVKDFTTKQGVVSSGDVRQGKLEGSPLSEANDYYGPLIGVSILAAIAILTALGLLVVIARKHGHNKAPITAAVQRKSVPHTAAYDNPSYKVEMQHETMDL